MSWANRYLRIRFKDRGASHDGCDCFGLVALIYREQRGITLPDYPEIPEGATAAKLRTILAAAGGPQWEEIAAGAEQPFDAVLMRGIMQHEGTRHSRPIHIGCVVTPGTLIHIEETGVTVVPYRKHPAVKPRITAFYRHVP